jgi:hypothetical protein
MEDICIRMKFIAIFLFLFLLIAQTFSKWLVVLDYTINKEYISKNLCENRSKPTMHCNGKCQLMKKMAAEENQTNNGSPGNPFVKASFSEVLLSDGPIVLSSLSSAIASNYNSLYLIKKTSSYISSVFHPPLV